jgi:hypothetical protein
VRAALAAVAVACASAGDPPGGPPDQDPPVVTRIAPDSGSVASALPSEALVYLNEVVNERVASPRSDISSAVLLSPVKGPVRVTWRRDHISVRPREGFQPGRVYRLEVFPVLTDLRQNRMKRGAIAVFSTGPALAGGRLDGAVVDWAGGRPAIGALIEAVLLPDSLPYRAVADSTGSFTLLEIPGGDYLVYGVVDQDNNRERGLREAYDTVRLHLADSATAELFAFPRDTTGPRLRTVEIADSLSLRLTFDRPLDPALVLDTSAIRLTSAADSATRLPVALVLTPLQFDSLRAVRAPPAAADSGRARTPADTARARAPADSGRARRAVPDTTRPRPAAADTARARVPALPAGAQPPRQGAPVQPGAARPVQPAAPRDSTRAQKMLARRPAPSAVRVVRLAEPLAPGARYMVEVTGVRSLSGVTGDARGQISVPVPSRRTEARRAAPADSTGTARDTSQAGGLRPPPP